MNNFFKLLLVITIMAFTLSVVLFSLALPALFKSPAPSLAVANGVVKSSIETSFEIGGLKMTRTFEYDSVSKVHKSIDYIGTNEMKTFTQRDGQPTVKDAGGQPVMGRHYIGDKGLQIPVSNAYFNTFTTVVISLLIIFCLAAIYITVQLYPLANAAARGPFFTVKNRVRLKRAGAFILCMSLFAFIQHLLMPWFLIATTGISGFTRDFNSDVIPVLPFTLVTGLLLILIARAKTD